MFYAGIEQSVGKKTYRLPIPIHYAFMGSIHKDSHGQWWQVVSSPDDNQTVLVRYIGTHIASYLKPLRYTSCRIHCFIE